MFEDKTYEELLQEKLEKVASSLDKREGSIIFDALAPNSLESAMIYVALDTILNETFADTASRDYLILRCKERGIAPLPATSAIAIGEFDVDIDIPIGSRFSGDKYNWVVTERISCGKYYLTCEAEGAAANGYLGQLIPIEYIEGLTTAEITSIVINGEDEESTESLRSRYLNSFANQSYGFNRGQYIEVTEALPGVGGCKPYRAWNGPGTVKLVITNSDYKAPSEELVNAAQTAIDPTQNSGEGIGIAPIDHEVTVVGVSETEINIETYLTFKDGWNLEECLPYIVTALDTYYKELNSSWGKEDGLLVRISQIESRLLNVQGIVDVSGTKLNGETSNITLETDSVAVRGVFYDKTSDIKIYADSVVVRGPFDA
ncbi:MAG: baseplate J/gp47 family protein [Eubacterium sp.]|nr:baseplate J/gp47 family protein [Eubacterium sp.]